MRLRAWVWVVLGAALLSLAVLMLAPPFNVKNIEVEGTEGNTIVSREVVVNKSGIVYGTNIFRVSKKKVENNLKGQEFVEDVTVTKKLPDTIVISVTEGKIAAYIRYDNDFVGINTSGKSLCRRTDDTRDMSVCVIYGLSEETSVIGEKAEAAESKKLENALQLINSFDTMGILDKMTALDVSDSENIKFRYTSELKVEFGDMSDYDYKIKCLEEILDELGDTPVGLVNLVNPENPTYRASID
ncbi:MAG: FtsQ-type POTRA domain-containing protein [Clostridia bacterium]|nr:FtsQ-type POTRA domain-containing protein [Clostridia bacterium]